jgi:hypothetical protein
MTVLLQGYRFYLDTSGAKSCKSKQNNVLTSQGVVLSSEYLSYGTSNQRRIITTNEMVAQTVARIYEQMATKDELHTVRQEMVTTEEMNRRFDAVEQRLGYRLETLERDVTNLKT